jgi:hypothetical protein
VVALVGKRRMEPSGSSVPRAGCLRFRTSIGLLAGTSYGAQGTEYSVPYRIYKSVLHQSSAKIYQRHPGNPKGVHILTHDL